MATTIIDTNTTTTVTLAFSDEYFLLQGVSHIVPNPAITVSGSFVDIFVFGTLSSTFNDTINFTSGSAITVFVGPTGSITSSPDFRPIDSVSANTTLINQGTISGSQMELDGAGSSVLNTGYVFGTSDGSTVSALTMLGLDARIVNSGTISSLSDVTVTVGLSSYINNSGIMDGVGTVVQATGGVDLLGLTLVNSGTISGQTAVATSTADDFIRNTGTIVGDILLGDGEDVVSGFGGVFAGNIDAGGGNDTVRVDDPGVTLEGGAGDDRLVLRTDMSEATGFETIIIQGDGDYQVETDDVATAIFGNSGDNGIYSGASNAVINGRGGDDEIFGRGGDDTIRGGSGNDFLRGDAGEDAIFGGPGDDTILGGTGADLLYGNQGADVFSFEVLADLGTGGVRDRIIGFQPGDDRIDLSEIGNDSFDFIGTSAFSGGGGMELRYQPVAGGRSLVQVDEDGDGVADGELMVFGVTVLSEADFLL